MIEQSGEKLRLAIVTDWFLPRLGGVEIHTADLARNLSERGVDVCVITTTPGPERYEGILVRRLRARSLPESGVAISGDLVAQLKAEFAAGRYDLVHTHISVISPTGFAAAIAAHSLGLPTIATFLSMVFTTAWLLRAAELPMGWSRWPLIVTAISTTVADQLRRANPHVDIEILPSGIDVERWRAPARGPRRPAGEIVAATAMRLTRKKRPLALLHSYRRARAAAARQGRHLVLKVAGAGPLMPRLEAAASRYNLTGDIDFLGRISRDDLARLYWNADLFLFPSNRESFGIAALEARAAGLPVVAMRGTGVTDFLKDGVSALLAGDDAEFQRHIEDLATDEELRCRLAAENGGIERFAWPRIVEAHLACYGRAWRRVNTAGAIPVAAR